MGRRIQSGDVDYAIDGISQGRTLGSVAKDLGFSPDNLSKHIRARGFDPSINRGGKVRIHLPESELIHAYRAGVSEKALAEQYKVSRRCIRRVLNAHGVDIRNRSAAMYQRMADTSPEERQELTKAAHAAVKGSKQSAEHREAIARSRCIGETHKGFGEDLLAQAFSSLGESVIQQHPVGPYNLDILFRDTVAVELTRHSPYRFSSTYQAERAEYIRNCGYRFIFVSSVSPDSFTANLNQVAANIQFLCSHPALSSEEWVIRCTTQRFTRLRNDLGQITCVPSPVKHITTTEVVNWG